MKRVLAPGGVLVMLVGLALVRYLGASTGLLYPDSYQYFLMARGLTEGGSPVLTLGAGGDVFVPNADAALKPLYPLLVAVVHMLGFTWLGAARLLGAVAFAVAAVAAGLAARRLTGSSLAGVAAGSVTAASPALSYWFGFAVPDAVAPAFALLAALALLADRGTTGGALAGLAIATRPEYAFVALAAGLAGAASPRLRALTVRAAFAATVTLAILLAAVRPPLASPPWVQLVIGLVASGIAAGLLIVAKTNRARGLALGAAVAGIAVVVGVTAGEAPGAETWLRSDWPLVAVGILGVVAALAGSSQRTAAVRAVVVFALLAVAYWTKNPSSDRYLAQLVPLVGLLAGIGVAAVPRRVLAATVVPAALVLTLLFAPVRAHHERDVFAATAMNLPASSQPLVTAAPDAYGFWLRTRTVRALRPGERGLIVLDAAQRAVRPDLTARGRTVARIIASPGFRRPDGRVDLEPAKLVLGVVERRREEA